MKKEQLAHVEIIQKDERIFNLKTTEKEIKKALKEYNKDGVLIVNGINEGYFFNVDEIAHIHYTLMSDAERFISNEMEKRGFNKTTDRNIVPIVKVIQAARNISGLSLQELKTAYDNYFI